MYEFNVGTDANFSPGTYNDLASPTTSALSPYTRGSTLRRQDCVPNRQTSEPGAVYYWRVRAVDDLTTYTPNPKINGVFSEVRSFLYDPRYVVADCPRQRGDRRRASPPLERRRQHQPLQGDHCPGRLR